MERITMNNKRPPALPYISSVSRVDYEEIATELLRAGYTLHQISLHIGRSKSWLGDRYRGINKTSDYVDTMNLFELCYRILPVEICHRILPKEFMASKRSPD